jgi:hypothetical protein
VVVVVVVPVIVVPVVVVAVVVVVVVVVVAVAVVRVLVDVEVVHTPQRTGQVAFKMAPVMSISQRRASTLQSGHGSPTPLHLIAPTVVVVVLVVVVVVVFVDVV